MLLCVVGGQLADLALVSPFKRVSLRMLQTMKEFCPKLRRLVFRFMDDRADAQHLIGKIVDRNGASLQTLALSADVVRDPVLKEFSSAWPDLCFDVGTSGKAAPKVLAALDGGIVKLELPWFDEVTAAHDFDCSRLETLVMDRTHVRAPHCTAKMLVVLAAKGCLPALRYACIVYRVCTPTDPRIP